MQDFIGSVCRSLVFKPSDAGGVFGGFVEKIGSIIRKPGIGLFSKPPVPALPPIAKSDAINVKKDDAFGRVYMGLKEKRHFKEKMQQQSKKDETKLKPLVRNRALKPSSLQLCMQMNEPDSNFGSKIWDPVGSDNTGSVNIWDYSDSEAAPASSWSTLPNRHFKEKMQQQSKKDETKWKPLVRNRALKPSSLQLCMQMNEPDSNFGSKIWDPVGLDNTGSVNIWDYSDSEAAPASSWSTLPNRSLLCRPLPVDIGRCTCVIVKEALPEGLDGGNLYSLYTNTNKIRVELEEKQKQHARLLVLVLAIGVGVMKKMKEKDEQIQRMGKLNWVLQERVKSLYVENQLWRDLVKIERQRANAAHLELEKERLAAATAAEDIMAMILKLQNEKSLIEMEANQYRRLTKEKQLHDQGVIHSLRWIVMKHELERGLLEDQLKFFRSHLVAKLIFLDQLCEISQYLPRSSLEAHVPYPILRSIYSQYYANSPSTPLALLSASPRQSPAVSLSHASPLIRPRGDSTPQSIVTDSGYFKASSAHGQDQPYDTDSGSIGGVDNNKHRNVRRSGPLDYSMSRKVKFVEGSTSGSTGPSPLPRFAVSKSGPISYK